MKRIRVKSAPIKFIAVFVIILLAFFLVAGYIFKAIKESEYFTLKEVTTRGATVDLSYLKGRNIFSIDLKQESEGILGSYPAYSRINLIRLLPDRLFADFLKRKPFACVKLYRVFVVDEEGVFFYPSDLQETLDLPLITGLETKIFGPKAGSGSNNIELRFALGIIKDFRRNRVLRSFRIRKIDMVNPAATSIFISPFYGVALTGNIEDIEIKVGFDNGNEKMQLLSGLLRLSRNSVGNIKYIDLRFKDPVIKFKNVKSQ